MHPVVPRLRDVWLGEPHHLDAACRVFEVGFGDGPAAFPGLSDIGLTYGPVESYFSTRRGAENRARRPCRLLTGGEVVKEVADSPHAKLVKRPFLLGLQPREVRLDRIVRRHAP